MPRLEYYVRTMTKKLASAFLLLALACSLTGTSFAKHKKKPTPASFDYYLLTMSWAPEFCATNPKGKSSSECDPKKHYGFVVHGLWPQNNTGSYPHDCSPAQPVSQAIVQQIMPIMPDSGLIQHEWAKHGTCSGLSTQDYFDSIQKAFGNVKVPEEYRAPPAMMKDSPTDIEKKFAEANGAPQGAFRVSCASADFVALEVCLTKDLQYQECATGLKECRTPQVSIRPTP
jgi:ribonuclease T2